MKEPYYSPTSIDRQAKNFLEKLTIFRQQHPYYLDPKKAALLIIDFQDFFFDSSSHAFVPSANAILPKVLKLQNYCLQNGMKVIQTQHINTKDTSPMMTKWWGDRLPGQSNPLVAIVPKIANPASVIINKSQYDAFHNSVLDTTLESNGIKQLIITGVMTHLCCETTARVAFTKGYEVFFTIDGTATYNREFHLGTLINLAHGFAVPMLIKEVLTDLKLNHINLK